MPKAAAFVTGLLQKGRYHFTTEDAVKALGGKRNSVARALFRLKEKGELATPVRGFYVAVPPEYRSLGCLPAEQFVPQLMDFHGWPYHVALLSAAQFHGAAHQRPQRFQVMVGMPIPSIECGNVAVDFFVRGDVRGAATVTVNTPRGFVVVSSPEVTALELVGYQKNAGGLNNVCTVLTELGESIDPARLVIEAAKVPLAWVQRLGFLLELSGHHDLAGSLQPFVREHARRVVALDASSTRTGARRSTTWLVAINTDVEPDI
jgi:predicted transcriptional regulator of viral defense system